MFIISCNFCPFVGHLPFPDPDKNQNPLQLKIAEPVWLSSGGNAGTVEQESTRKKKKKK